MTTQSIPLTTSFVPSPSCLSDYYWNVTGTPFLSLGPPSTSDCLPSGWSITSQHFSPGVCPSGYHIACSTVTALGANIETQATCCPSSYSCQTKRRDSWYSTEVCTISQSDLKTDVLTVTEGFDGTVSVFTTLLTTGGVNAYGISIRFQAGDFSTTDASSVSSTHSMSSMVSTALLPSTSFGPTPTLAPSTSGKVSTGAKIGLSVGLPLAGLISLVLLYLFIRKGPKKEKEIPKASPRQDDYLPTGGRQELDNLQQPKPSRRAIIDVQEAGGTDIMELHE